MKCIANEWSICFPNIHSPVAKTGTQKYTSHRLPSTFWLTVL